MVKYKIVYDRDACIGAYACTPYAPELWLMNSEDNKADLKGAIFILAARPYNAPALLFVIFCIMPIDEPTRRSISFLFFNF